MAFGPRFPVDVPDTERVVDGDQKTHELAETHRKNKSLVNDTRSHMTPTPTGLYRYKPAEEEA